MRCMKTEKGCEFKSGWEERGNWCGWGEYYYKAHIVEGWWEREVINENKH